MKNTKKKIVFITHSAVIAALYVVLTMISAMLGLSGGVVQLRLSEALTVLPFFTPAAVWGLFIGCFISNILFGAIIIDVIFGSLATLIGAVITYLLRKTSPYLAPVAPIASNTIIIPLVLKFAYGFEDAFWFISLTVFLGEFLSCGILGLILLLSLKKYSKRLFGSI